MGTILLGLNVDQIESDNLSTLVGNPRDLGIDRLIAYLCGLVFAKDSVSRLLRNQFDERARQGKVLTYSAISIAQIPVPHPRSNMRGGSWGFT